VRFGSSDIPIIGITVAPGGSVFYNQSANVVAEADGLLYLDVAPPIRRMHFSIYSLPGGVMFRPWRVDQLISVGDLAKEISNTV